MLGDQMSDWTQADRDDPGSSRVTEKASQVGSKRIRDSSMRLLAIAEAASVSTCLVLSCLVEVVGC